MALTLLLPSPLARAWKPSSLRHAWPWRHQGKPFSVAKIASYMHVPRTTVIRRLSRLQSWGLIDRRGRSYYLRERTLNSLIGMRSYQQVRRILSEATKELTVLDTFPG
jgi:DNA-binding IclR family transcriptional regulator